MNNNPNPIYYGNNSYKPYTSPNQEYAPTIEGNMNQIGQGLITPTLPIEQSYIENILRLNTNKMATIYMSYSDSIEHKDMTYQGIIEEAGRDHIILSDPTTGKWYILLMIYLDYIQFEEPITYSTSFKPNT